MSDALVEVRDVSKIYRQGPIEVRALSDVSLSFRTGEFAALAGPSGSGKTTLLNIIGALDVPTDGTVLFEGENLGDARGSRLAQLRLHRMGFVFQAYNLIPVLSAYENAEYVLLLQGVGAAERRARVNKILADVGLEGLEHRRPNELSGGQQQRVAVARAIAASPSIVLADEPTANLDSKTGADLVDLMHTLNRDHGVTFVFSSHDPKVLDRVDRVVELEDGRVVADQRRGADAA